MGKPKKPKLPIKIRRRWSINPKTKIKKSAKRYLRKKEKRNVRQEIKDAI